ncbi:EscU/YscU/HrcU family type III secretion system export apparatus switch protein [Ruminiclostridium cellobioparum]|uniref:Flagellar protein FhlB-like protein n=1 Tax=Ruminiclostridium cellobioparum subsp. termitidis CT1112 TaxID=1195236 RepID=S0FHA3_RUMCE|nr:EscU/YscU/HrcU family type III secretion system export apparatus switch protein [Ruminiclostridium cellobioparum]EMS71075.1 flagellar protein FhlB-like protein [Ruminiclostridium cellobioparum subsp. termitidis CT1112]
MQDKDKNRKGIRHAAALQYSPETDAAPKVVATGKGIVAEKMIEKAKEADIPVYQNTELAQTLSALGIGDQIPPEVYDVVAEILIFIGSVDKSYGQDYED